jgi:phosphoglycolate phosphatase
VVERSFAAVMAELGLAADDAAMDHVRRTMGQPKIDVFRSLLGDEGRARRASAAFDRVLSAAVAAGEVEALPGAVEVLGALRGDGIKVCLTTGFSAAVRDAIIDHLGWGPLVDLALAPSDAGRGRPWPDMILTAVLRLGVDAVQEVAVAGDTVSDLEAGTRAGASVVAGVLGGAHDRATLAAAPHTHLLDDITALPAVVAGADRAS